MQFNKRFGLLDEADDGGLFKQLHRYLIYVCSVGIYNEFHTAVHWIKTKLDPSGLSAIVDFAKTQITDTMKQQKQDEKLAGRKDFAAQLLRMHQDDPAGFPMAKVFATAITNVGAGSDTTSLSLAAIMYYLMANPACYRKVSSIHTLQVSYIASSKYILLTLHFSCALKSTKLSQLARSLTPFNTAKPKPSPTCKLVSRKVSACIPPPAFPWRALCLQKVPPSQGLSSPAAYVSMTSCWASPSN